MDPSQLPVKRIVLRAVLKGVSPLVARVLSVPDSLALTHFHAAFLAVLGWRSDPDFIIRVHGQQFASLRRRSRGMRLRDLQLRRQETFLYICNLLDLWEWEVRVLERGGPRFSDSLLRWSPDPTGGIWNATQETELPG